MKLKYLDGVIFITFKLVHIRKQLKKHVIFEVFTAMTEEFRLLGCEAAWLSQEPTSRRNVSPPSSERKQ
jgi:hypothetical protein